MLIYKLICACVYVVVTLEVDSGLSLENEPGLGLADCGDGGLR